MKVSFFILFFASSPGHQVAYLDTPLRAIRGGLSRRSGQGSAYWGLKR